MKLARERRKFLLTEATEEFPSINLFCAEKGKRSSFRNTGLLYPYWDTRL
jgi:hypothetical protein